MEKLQYTNFINFNFNITELKNGNDAFKLLKHMYKNQNRLTGRERLNPKPEVKNDYEGKKPEEIKKEFEAIKDQLPKGGKGSKPFRFITSALNVEPTKENGPIIEEGAIQQIKLYQKIYGKENVIAAAIHMNETRPGLHIAIKNYSKQKGKGVGGVYNQGKKVNTSGPKGKEVINQIGKEGEEINKGIAEKYGKEFKQEETTNIRKSRTIQQVRKIKKEIIQEKVIEVPVVKEVVKKVEVQQLKEIQEAIIEPFNSEVINYTAGTGKKYQLVGSYDPSDGSNTLFIRGKDLYNNGADGEQLNGKNGDYRKHQDGIQGGQNFKNKVNAKILNIEPETEAITNLKEKIKGRSR